MFREDVAVAMNGLVLMDPAELRRVWGGPLRTGTNVLTRFTTSELGDRALREGACVPVLQIHDGHYDVVVRTDDEPCPFDDDAPLRTNGTFPLVVTERLVVADLAVLWDWHDDAGWHDTGVGPGTYAVTVHGYDAAEAYELVLQRTPDLTDVSGDLSARMTLWD